MDALKPSGKPFEITKWEVWEAYRQVKANRGAPGVDGVTLEEFDKDLKNNLYKIWNRMSSGVLFSASGAGGGDTETAWRWDENPWGADDLGQGGPNGGGAEAGGEGRADLSSGLLWLSTVPVGSGRGGGMSGAVLEDRLGGRFGHPEVFRCFVTLRLSLLVMIKIVLPGWVGAGYAGLFGVRCARGRLAVRRA